MGHLGRRDVVAQPELCGIQAEPPGEDGHRSLHGEAHEGLADAAIGSARALVGEHGPPLVANGGNAVPVGDIPELDQVVLGRGEEVLSLVRHVAHAERQERAVGPVGELDVHHAVTGVHEGGEVLHAILDPLHGPARGAREEGADEQIGRPALVAEGAADVGAAEPQAGLRHAERGGENRDGQPRPLVVRPELEAVRSRIVRGHGAEGLEGRRGIALYGEALAQHPVGPRHGAVDVAVAERVVPDDIGAELRVEEGRAGLHGLVRIHYRGERLVFDADELERVFGGGAVGRGHRGHRLADVAHDVDSEAVVRHGGGGGDQWPDGTGQAGGVGPGEHGGDSRTGQSLPRVDRADACMRVRAPEHRRVEHAGPSKVVDEAPAAGHETDVLLEGQGGADPGPTHEDSPVVLRAVAAACSTAFTILT